MMKEGRDMMGMRKTRSKGERRPRRESKRDENGMMTTMMMMTMMMMIKTTLQEGKTVKWTRATHRPKKRGR